MALLGKGLFLNQKDDWMEHLRTMLTEDIEKGSVNRKIEKIIFDIVFQHVKDMVFIMKVEKGPHFRYIFVNESGIKHAGINLDSIGKTLQEVLPYEQAFLLQKQYKRLLKCNDTLVFFDEVQNGCEAKFYGETILTPVKDDKGIIRYVVAVVRDITDKLIEKKRLIESEQRYRSIVDNNMDAIFSIDLEGTILEANPAASQLIGYSEEQVKQQSIYNFD